SGALVAGGLLLIEEIERPFLTRSLRVADRVTAHLLGDDTPDQRVLGLLTTSVPAASGPVEALRRTRELGARLWYIRERPGAAGVAMAVAALTALGTPHLTVDLGRLAREDDALDVVSTAIREARLAGGSLVAGPIEVLADKVPAIRLLAEAACPVAIVGVRQWDPAWTPEVPVLLQAPLPSVGERSEIWRAMLNGHAPATVDPAGGTTPFRLTPEQVRRAARAAEYAAAAEGQPIDTAHLLAGARAQNAAGLERLSRRIEPRVRWDDLVLPPDTVRQLTELTARARHRDRVLDDWGMAARASKGRGLTALFAGDSGTGKTMSAEVVAADLGLDLYVIDLSTVVDKYIGETEKNLDRIFAEADRVNAVLLFDEADAIFGKRSEVKDARDRYANVEIAYLLQRMEQFDGLAILTTNLRANVDEAFLRRLDVIADFPTPEEEDRLRLWELHLAPALPREDDIDLDFLAGAFKLSGGNIRNICLAAAFLAAAEERPVSMTDLARATEREYQKLGRMIHVSEFGPYFELLRVTG
ncbi:MAG: ATP-binding protein, partial [Chloroflexi bacterium]|nr:ATP-binding protein [Chloroflexota bacterium]